MLFLYSVLDASIGPIQQMPKDMWRLYFMECIIPQNPIHAYMLTHHLLNFHSFNLLFNN